MRLSAPLATLLLLATTVTAAAAPPPSGDQILARAVAFPGVRSYSVPVQFDVHLHKPIGLRANVEGTVDYAAPRDGALVITKAHGLIGGFFRGTYHLDLVPQAWPARYHVTSVRREASPNGPTIELAAVPKGQPGDVTAVTFQIGGRYHAPVAATWAYRDGSSIALTFAYGPVGAGALPQTATVHVDKPKDKLDATVSYGSYALNAPIDPAVFSAQ